MKTSKKWRIDWRDVAQGLLIAILTPVLVIIQSSLDAGVLRIDWKDCAIAAVAGGVSYLIKNLLSDQKAFVSGKVVEKNEQDGTA